MLTKFYSVIKRLTTRLNEKGSTSLENIGFALTATTLVSAVVVVTGNTVVLDMEERTHIFNAQAMAEAATLLIGETNTGPSLDGFIEISLQDLYAADRVAPAVDASGDGVSLYHSDDSSVLIQNITDENSGSANRSINVVFVKLVSEGGYVYTDQTDKDSSPPEDRVTAVHLSKDNIEIPRRNADGIQ